MNKPRIVCAANKLPDGTLIIGVRHWDPLMRQQADALNWWHHRSDAEQGFIDQYRNFYTREEAWLIVEEQRQILYRVGADMSRDGIGCLFSENLYQ